MRTAILAFALLAGLPAMAQTNQAVVKDFKPSSLNQPGKQYPQVNSERRVRARVVAPQAQSVTLDFSVARSIPWPRARTAPGSALRGHRMKVFTTTNSLSMAPRFRIPAACISTAAAAGAAALEVPAQDQDFYALKDVPHGQLRETSTIPRAPKPISAASFTRRRIMKRIRPSVIRCCICNTAAGKMKPAGAARGTPV